MREHGIHYNGRMALPTFLDLPARETKPRAVGLTHVLDNGLSPAETRARLSSVGPQVDLWKFGWGIGYLDPHLREKLNLLADNGIQACTGGTLLEISWLQDAVPELLDWAQDAGFACLEVSSGSVDLPREVKSDLIAQAAERFVVLAEIGAKSPDAPVSVAQWCADAEADLAAGARWVVTEGRESGTVGMFEADGAVRAGLADALVAAVGADRLIFEAPRRAQQAWLIRRHGHQVNLGNIAPAEVLAVETLRLGLRSDTLPIGLPRAGLSR